MFQINVAGKKVELSAFVWITALWIPFAIGTTTYFYPGSPSDGLLFGLSFFIFALSNLFFLVKMIEVTTNLMSDQATEKRGLYQIQVVFWVTLKLISFGGLFFLIWKFQNQVILPALVCGVGTLIVVPLFGGYWWSRKELEG